MKPEADERRSTDDDDQRVDVSVQKPPSPNGFVREGQVVTDVLGRGEFCAGGHALIRSCRYYVSRTKMAMREDQHRHHERREKRRVHDSAVGRQHQPEQDHDQRRSCSPRPAAAPTQRLPRTVSPPRCARRRQPNTAPAAMLTSPPEQPPKARRARPSRIPPATSARQSRSAATAARCGSACLERETRVTREANR